MRIPPYTRFCQQLTWQLYLYGRARCLLPAQSPPTAGFRQVRMARARSAPSRLRGARHVVGG
eukprot:5282279-Pleurochrysis_carterae.AAC.1